MKLRLRTGAKTHVVKLDTKPSTIGDLKKIILQETKGTRQIFKSPMVLGLVSSLTT